MTKILFKELSYKIQGAFFEVYKNLGNSHKEIVYHKALVHELENNGFKVDDQKRINVNYKGKYVGVYVPDIIVDDAILLELKCKPRLIPNDVKQFWQYLRGSDYKLGYLVNFGSAGKVEYIRRVYDKARK